MKKLDMKTNKLLFVLMIGLSSAIAVRCSQQTITPAQMRQNIIDDAMQPENYKDLKQDLAFLESQGLLQADSFYNLLQENITESDDATFNEVIEKAEDLLTKHMKNPFISTLERALKEKKPLAEYIDYTMPAFGTIEIPLFTYVMQHKDNDMSLNNIVREWLLGWSETREADGRLPLYIAAEKGHAEIVQRLIIAGANVNINTTEGGLTPLYIAAINGHTSIVQLLLAAGANFNIQGNIGTTPLYFAALNGYTEIVVLLLEAGASVNIQINGNGFTPLHIAAMKCHTEIVQILVTAGADVNIQNHHSQLAEEVAKTDEIRDILRRAQQSNNQSQVERCLIS